MGMRDAIHDRYALQPAVANVIEQYISGYVCEFLKVSKILLKRA